MNLLAPFRGIKARNFETQWQAPSNIAFVKYWGKKGHQLPANPSLSMTLANCTTRTSMKITPAAELSVELFLGGVAKAAFADKIKKYLISLQSELPFLKEAHFRIDTLNTFPHGTGIASSASGMAAVALCLTDFLYSGKEDPSFYKIASSLARLASGSACRSLYGGFTTWGDESDEFATAIEVHPEMKNLCDDVLVISSEEKTVSSSKGHERMQEHPFAEARFIQARDNFQRCLKAMQTADMDELGRILEVEALSLHAMMMTSPEGFTLFKPGSLTAMEKVRSFRRETKLPLYFTLDAGPNLHLIYPSNQKIKNFIQQELRPLGENLIQDQAGKGPTKC